jgi:hypothetical protein
MEVEIELELNQSYQQPTRNCNKRHLASDLPDTSYLRTAEVGFQSSITEPGSAEENEQLGISTIQNVYELFQTPANKNDETTADDSSK